MKSLKCDMCDYMGQGETFEDWMNNLMGHYYAAHPEVMKDSSKTKEDMDKWMVDKRARFDAA